MRTKKAMFNMIASMMYQIVAIICGLITPKLILGAFGSTYNGVVNSAAQYLSMINILNMGITATTRVALYKTLANKDVIGTSRIMKATKKYMRKIALILVVYAIGLSILYPLFAHNDLTKSQCATLILIVSMGTFAELFFGISNQTLLQAAQESYVTYALNIAKTILNTVIVAVLINIGASIYIVKLGSSIVFFLIPLIQNYYVKRKFGLRNDCGDDNTAIKGRNAATFHVVANVVHNNTDLVVLTLFTDAKLISVYTVYYLVVGKVKSMLQVITAGMEAAFGDLWVKKEFHTLKNRFSQYEFMIYTFTIIIFSCVGLLILPFIKLYTANVHDAEYVRISLAVLITITEAVFCIRQPYLTLVYATGSFEETKIGALIEAIINIVLSVVLVWKIGIEGVIIGTLVANIFRTIQFSVFVEKKILKLSIKNVVVRIMWGICTSLSIIFLFRGITSILCFGNTWAAWIGRGITAFIIACIITLLSSAIFYKGDMLGLFRTFLRSTKR